MSARSQIANLEPALALQGFQGLASALKRYRKNNSVPQKRQADNHFRIDCVARSDRYTGSCDCGSTAYRVLSARVMSQATPRLL
jgi:hypothetical protein